MATILEFRAHVAKYPEFAERRDPRQAGEIVIFPGVRYERDAEAAAPAKTPGKRLRQRDRLELDE